jgi:Flp pilus assembly protein protease CpaA
MKGYRTIITNAASIVVMVSAAVLQYADQLPVTDSQAAMLGLSATIIVNIGNMYLRAITTTPVGQSQ